ncbi:hypothetical protein V5799_022143 [Amblyomma americanum]|uniref:Uncharacterized protein n=1 Tax=Amblyomma americanum TaxID=6943 RepID=A0AAQ4FLB4_AMBAM
MSSSGPYREERRGGEELRLLRKRTGTWMGPSSWLRTAMSPLLVIYLACSSGPLTASHVPVYNVESPLALGLRQLFIGL